MGSLDSQALEGIWQAAAANAGDAPGHVVLVAHDGEAHVHADGVLGSGRAAMQRDSLFRITSMTKPIVAVAVLRLIEEGLIGLDEPVDRLLPELAGRTVLRRPDGPLDDTVPAERAITTRDLLTFTCGWGLTMEMFTSGTPWPVFAQADQVLRLGAFGPPTPTTQPDPDTWMSRLGTLPLIAQPGDRWLYNTSAQILGVLASRAGGAPLQAVLERTVLEPLGMFDTSFGNTQHERLGTEYMSGPHGLAVADEADGAYGHAPVFPDGAAGLVSTVDDYHRFARFLLRGDAHVLPTSVVRAMTSDQLTPHQRRFDALGPGFFAHQSWGYGIAVQDDGSFGWNGGFGTSALIDPQADLIVLVMTQRMFDSPTPQPLHTAVQQAARGAVRH